MLRAALHWACAAKLLSAAPSFRIDIPNNPGRTDWLTKDEVRKLMAVAKPHLALFILIAVSTAKRREAILSLTWDRVALHMQGYESIDFGDDVGKKRRGTTTIAGHARLLPALRAAKVEWEKAKAANPETSDHVIQFRGKRIFDIQDTIATACRDAGIRKVSAHIFKHTSITWMVQQGMSYEQISKAANTTKEVIERVYGHHDPKFLSEVASAVSF